MIGLCACGGAKDAKSRKCHACYEAQRISARMARRLVPRKCGCRNFRQPSPWHCFCGRWKPSTVEFCEVCLTVESVLRTEDELNDDQAPASAHQTTP